MKYGLLLWPHANARYFAGMVNLAVSETNVLLRAAKIDASAAAEEVSGMTMVTFECEPLSGEALAILREHSLFYWLVCFEENGAFRPAASRAEAYLGSDLPLILKYKGKTNEFFSAYLLNLAVYCGRFMPGEKLTVLDPMCSKATTPFLAADRGWNSVGIDIEKKDIAEADQYFKRYLEYHKFKYTRKDTSLTVAGKKPFGGHIYTFSRTPEAFKKGDTRTLSLYSGNALDIDRAFRAETFHAAAADLPYGVQHAPGGAGSLDELAEQLIRHIRPVLKKGGCLALSYNENTLSKVQIDVMLEKAGYTVLTGEDFDGLSHWVEQAVTRNVSVARK